MTSVDRKLLMMELLHAVTYNAAEEIIPSGHKQNMFMGAGLWSNRHGLSEGLPLDILHMLIPIRILQELVFLKNPERKLPKVYILIADSMALREIGKKGVEEQDELFRKLGEIKFIYARSIGFLITALRLNAEILYLSEIEATPVYERISKEVSELSCLETVSPENFLYVQGQLASTKVMYEEFDAGLKIGWSKIPEKRILEDWDEPKFDQLSKIACPEISYIYTKAGLNGLGSEAPPYTAFGSSGKRCVLHLRQGLDMKFPKIKADSRWALIRSFCKTLFELELTEKAGESCEGLAIRLKENLG
jgi:hypothetical protein